MERLTEREKEVLALIRDDPLIAQDELAARLRITRSATAVHISNLLRKGALLGRGYYFTEPAGVLLLGWLGLEVEACLLPAGQGRVEVVFGGAVYRLSRRLAQLEVPAGVLGVVGGDQLGEMLLKELEGAGVGTGHVLISPHHKTPRRVHWIEGRNKRIADDGEAMRMLNSHYLATRENLLNRARVVVVDESIAPETVAEACRVLDQARGNIVQLQGEFGVDVAPGAVVIFWQAGGELSSAEALAAAHSVVTAGARAGLCPAKDGVAMVDENGERFTGAAPGRQGAGEDLVVGVLYGLARGYQLRQAVRIGLASPAKNHPA